MSGYHIKFGFISQGSVNFKFGVLYAKDGQLTDDEMFSNGEFFTFVLIVLFIWIKKKSKIVPTAGSRVGGNGYMNSRLVWFHVLGEKLSHRAFYVCKKLQ